MKLNICFGCHKNTKNENVCNSCSNIFDNINKANQKHNNLNQSSQNLNIIDVTLPLYM